MHVIEPTDSFLLDFYTVLLVKMFSDFRMGKNLCEGKSAMTQWIEDCKTFFGAHFDEIYKGVYKTIESKVFFTEMEYYTKTIT